MKVLTKSLLALVVFLVATLVATPLVSAAGPFSGENTGKLAVTSKGYDDIGQILKDLGYSATEITLENLKSLDELKKYDVVYINCASGVDGVATEVGSIIAEYVKGGGIIYASDFANSIMQEAFPNKIDFYGEEQSGYYTPARVGSAGEVEASIVDPGLAAVLGKKKVKVNYDMGSWAVIDKVGTGVRVHAEGPVSVVEYNANFQEKYQDIDWNDTKAVQKYMEDASKAAQPKSLGAKPYIVSFSEGQGEVLYTTFHNETQKTADMGKVVSWFATRTKGANLAKDTRDLALKDNDAILQEVVDSINKDKTKKYEFNATGEKDFEFTLGFLDGGVFLIVILDPDGEEVVKKEVDSAPFTQEIEAKKGKYVVQITGKKVPSKNTPIVLTTAGPEAAAADEILDYTSSSSSVWSSLLKNKWVWIIIGVIVAGIIIVAAIVVVVVLLVRKK